MDENPNKVPRNHVHQNATGQQQTWRQALIVVLLLAASLVGLVALAMAPVAPRIAKSNPMNDPSREAIGRDATMVGICAIAWIIFELGRVLLTTIQLGVP